MKIIIVDEIEVNPNVSVNFQAGSRWMSVNGKAKLVREKSKIDELWKETLRPWFPEGKESADICLIQVIPEIA